ncbi:hypothetical protein [Vibrio ouci]|uniref:hypothetical protein n=1 Tax=Vibrio ouci TaxID=2499078 RepID=UPI001FCA0D93|nr:hypothetical protein [Vibrio ouci]
MKKTWVVLLSVLAIAPVSAQDESWHKSPQLEALVFELKQLYATDNLSELKQEHMTQVDNLSFFILYSISTSLTPLNINFLKRIYGVCRKRIFAVSTNRSEPI